VNLRRDHNLKNFGPNGLDLLRVSIFFLKEKNGGARGGMTVMVGVKTRQIE